MDASGLPVSDRVTARLDQNVPMVSLLLDVMDREYRPYSSKVTYPESSRRRTPLAVDAGIDDVPATRGRGGNPDLYANEQNSDSTWGKTMIQPMPFMNMQPMQKQGMMGGNDMLSKIMMGALQRPNQPAGQPAGGPMAGAPMQIGRPQGLPNPLQMGLLGKLFGMGQQPPMPAPASGPGIGPDSADRIY